LKLPTPPFKHGQPLSLHYLLQYQQKFNIFKLSNRFLNLPIISFDGQYTQPKFHEWAISHARGASDGLFQ
jgi:hypothetical protein